MTSDKDTQAPATAASAPTLHELNHARAVRAKEPIGKGGQGSVDRYTFDHEGQSYEYAAKQFAGTSATKSCAREAAVMARLDAGSSSACAPVSARCLGVLPESSTLLMELAPNGSLYKMITVSVRPTLHATGC